MRSEHEPASGGKFPAGGRPCGGGGAAFDGQDKPPTEKREEAAQGFSTENRGCDRFHVVAFYLVAVSLSLHSLVSRMPRLGDESDALPGRLIHPAASFTRPPHSPCRHFHRAGISTLLLTGVHRGGGRKSGGRRG